MRSVLNKNNYYLTSADISLERRILVLKIVHQILSLTDIIDNCLYKYTLMIRVKRMLAINVM